MHQTIYSHFRSVAEPNSEAAAIILPDGASVTFGELLGRVDELRCSLNSHGIGRSQRLGLLVNDRTANAFAHLLATSTCTSVPLSPDMPAGELAPLIDAMRIDAVLVAGDVPEALIQAIAVSRAQVVSAKICGDGGILDIPHGERDPEAHSAPPEPDDIAVLLRTSGTTSKPKIAPQSQSNRVASMTRARGPYRIGPGDRSLNMMPLHHTQGLNAEFLTPIINGASVVLADFVPSNVVNLVRRWRPTWFTLVPSMHEMVLAEIGQQTDVMKGSGLRFARASSAKLPVALRTRMQQVYGVPVVESYGATETSAVASTGLVPEEYREGSVGIPYHDKVKVTDPEGNELPPLERGEICVGGPTVISGYENAPEANASAFRDGWYRTGDEGYFDEDGYLYVTGRLSETLSRGGEKFSLAAVDEALLTVGGVAAGAAFIRPHEKLGDEVFAAVVAENGVDVKQDAVRIRSELASHLPWALVPKKIYIVPQLPLNGTGKVVREKIREIVGE